MFQENSAVENDVPLSTFMSKDPAFKYFRINPAIPKCYAAIVHQHNKFIKASGTQTIRSLK